VVDVEWNARNLIKKTLEAEDHQVISVAGFEEAIAMIWASMGEGNVPDIDLIITDIKLSGGSGIELIKKLSESGITIPIIVTGGAVPPESVAEAMKAGAIDFISKPFSEDELLEKVDNILKMEKDTFGKLERRAKNLLEVGNLSLADRVIKQMFSVAPSSPVPHFLYYKLLKLRGNEELALKHLQCSLLMDKSYAPAFEEWKRIGEEIR